MKKLFAVLLALVFVLALFSGCQKQAAKETYEIALVTDIGTIDDKSFNQSAWEGIQDYADAAKVSYKYYQPTENSTDARLAQMELAVNNGAKVIVCPGFLFEETVAAAAPLYPEVSFIVPDVDFSAYDLSNVLGVTYAEDQSGYLAGYAAVKDGYTKLGAMMGMAVPAVVKYGLGYVLGADAAAAELGVNIDMMYYYTGGFAADPAIQTMSATWYSEGTEVIFAAGGSLYESVFAAAEEAGKATIGVDKDQAGDSETVITSAMKGVRASVKYALDLYYAGNFPGGTTITLDAASQGVELPMATSKFKTFSQADYDALFAKFVSGEIARFTDTTEINPAKALPLTNTNVTFVE